MSYLPHSKRDSADTPPTRRASQRPIEPLVWPPPPRPEPTSDDFTPIGRPQPPPAPSPPHPTPRRRPSQAKSCFTCFFWLMAGAAGAMLGLVGIALFIAYAFPPGRTNVLLLGMDRRPGESAVSRTDTMILTTVVPERRYIGMLSIPRDLYVEIPGRGLNRINSAHAFAEAAQAGTGPDAAVAAVSHNFGITLDRYVRIDFEGFVRIVDAMGGIDVDVPKAIVDYSYPTYDYGVTTVAFDPGPQHMDGERALAYARTRHGSSDFARAERQQLVIQAMFTQLTKPATWLRLPAVANAARSSLTTNLGSVELIRLAPTLLSLSPADWDRRVIKDDMVQAYTTEAGASVQRPVWERINPVLMEMFGE